MKLTKRQLRRIIQEAISTMGWVVIGAHGPMKDAQCMQGRNYKNCPVLWWPTEKEAKSASKYWRPYNPGAEIIEVLLVPDPNGHNGYKPDYSDLGRTQFGINPRYKK